MIGCYDFCGHYEWTFGWFEQEGGHELVRAYWDEAIYRDSQMHATTLIREKGIPGMLEYWGHTLLEESPDLGFHISHGPDVFRIDFHQCPSRGFLIRNDLKNYSDYCDHCMGWTGPMLGDAGYAIDHEHNHRGQCWWEIRKTGTPGGHSPVGSVAGAKDSRLLPNWNAPDAKFDRYEKANDPDKNFPVMKIVKQGGHRLFETDPETARYVADLLERLRRDGMDAVRALSKQFDDWTPASFELTEKQVAEAVAQCSQELRDDTDFCQGNVRRFAQEQLKMFRPLEVESPKGVWLGHKHIPVSAVGSYVPGGRYPMFGSAQMSIIPAKVAGVKTVVACTPPVKGSGYYPATINAMKQAGADRIFVLGGVPAMALMAFGMGEVDPVDILCGAGNKFVAEAKRQLFGQCGIDLLAGPTEIAVIADDSGDPSLVACDLLGQAEHDPASGQLCVCLSEKFAQEVLKEVERQLPLLPTHEIARQSWNSHGKLYVAESREEAIQLSDDYAPEHLELHVSDTEWYFDRLKNYGSLFIGEETTVAYGDKSIGTNHILPTSRSARYTGGVWVGKFLKTVTYQRMTPEASIQVGAVTARQCDVERMAAHAVTARVRVERYGSPAKR